MGEEWTSEATEIGRESRELAVILPTVRMDDWFEESVNSILSQKDVDFDLVLILDGVRADLKADWLCDDRVFVVRHVEKVGLVAGLNDALGRTRHPFVARMDADDIACPGRLRIQLEYLKSHPETVVVAGEAMRMGSDGRDLGAFRAAVGPDVRYTLLNKNTVVHPAVMFRRSAYVSAGGLDVKMNAMEDYELWLRMGRTGCIAALPETLVRYRLHSGQVSRGAKPYGYAIRRVRRERARLARHLGVERRTSTFQSVRWSVAQYLRYFGLRRAGYDN